MSLADVLGPREPHPPVVKLAKGYHDHELSLCDPEFYEEAGRLFMSQFFVDKATACSMCGVSEDEFDAVVAGRKVWVSGYRPGHAPGNIDVFTSRHLANEGQGEQWDIDGELVWIREEVTHVDLLAFSLALMKKEQDEYQSEAKPVKAKE